MGEPYHQGDFTLPGEAGYEELTLALAKKWGADVIRDSDGTKLSARITGAGYGVYSTVCVIREHNAFALSHPETQQQTFLCSKSILSTGDSVTIPLLDGYFTEQFAINDTPDAMRYWQAFDRTANVPLPADAWRYENGRVTIAPCVPFHEYTISFLCWRVWEEINMYNHTSNHWTSEHLRQLDPRHPLAWAFLLDWMEDWCRQNPATTVVRFTSMFYNFVWIFGSDARNRSLFSDWASYDFTVSPAALDAFERAYGYKLTAEDFINGGNLWSTHRPPTQKKRDYMAFIQAFVAEKAGALVDIVHRHGKKAYVFYDDSWVGLEPYGERFQSIGFDGIIKCVFSGYECRLCAGVKVPTHELRFHPYLFPVGLGGQPTFAPGGDPTRDALGYWVNVRRALLRQPVDRIGLGGYLHLTEGFPDFCDAVERMAIDFRHLKALHAHGAPETLPCRVAVLHAWGDLRSWTLSGHFHETNQHALVHIIEALSGLPVSVRFISFSNVLSGALHDIDVVINAGRAGDAWSGGDAWKDDALVETLTRFVYEGGALIGVDEPSAADGYATLFRMAHVLGVDKDNGERACHGRWAFQTDNHPPFPVRAEALGDDPDLYLTDGEATVLCEKRGAPQMTLRRFGAGFGAYMSFFTYSRESARMLLDLLLYVRGIQNAPYLSADPRVEAAYFPADRTLVVVNNANEAVETEITAPARPVRVKLQPMEMRFVKLEN